MVTVASTGLGSRFRRLAVSGGASNLADGVFKLALPLAAIVFTRSPTLVAGLELVRSLPWLLLALPVGALTDRLDRRRTMIAANLVRTSAVCILAAVLQTGNGSLPVLYLVAVITGIAEVFYDTSSQTILPSLVDRDQLGRANGRLGAIELGAQQFVGPPLAGLLVGLGGGRRVLDHHRAVGCSRSLRWSPSGDLPPGTPGRLDDDPQRRGRGPALPHDPADAAKRWRPWSAWPTSRLRPPARSWSSSRWGKDSVLGLTQARFGLLFLTSALGSVVITAAIEPIERRLGRSRTLAVSVAGMVLFVATPAVTGSVWLIAVAMFVGGALIMVWNVITVSFRQAVTPDHLLGRLNSVYRLLAWGTMPIGAAVGGLTAEAFGLRAVFASMGVLAALLFLPAATLTDEALDAAERASAGPGPGA